MHTISFEDRSKQNNKAKVIKRNRQSINFSLCSPFPALSRPIMFIEKNKIPDIVIHKGVMLYSMLTDEVVFLAASRRLA